MRHRLSHRPRAADQRGTSLTAGGATSVPRIVRADDAGFPKEMRRPAGWPWRDGGGTPNRNVQSLSGRIAPCSSTARRADVRSRCASACVLRKMGGPHAPSGLARRDQHGVRPHLPLAASSRALRVTALAFERKQGRRLGMLGVVFHVVDADGWAWSGPGDEGAVWLLHHQRNPAVVVALFPDHQAPRVRVSRGGRLSGLGRSLSAAPRSA